ncbi:MAG: hypothetical protein AB8B77_09055 [Alphaproteobacteria bacterium]
MLNQTETTKTKLLICFSKGGGLPLLKGLKSDFKHCFALILLPELEDWLYLDPLIPGLEIRRIGKNELGTFMASLIQDHHHIIPAYPQDPLLKRRAFSKFYWHWIAPFRFYHCVQIMLELMGRPDGFILTPYKLFKHLMRKFI